MKDFAQDFSVWSLAYNWTLGRQTEPGCRVRLPVTRVRPTGVRPVVVLPGGS